MRIIGLHRLRLRPWERHSLVLVVLGFVYALIGLTYVLFPPTHARLHSLNVALNIMPIQGWGVAFVLVGLCSMISSRWPPANESWGYVALSSLSTLWGAFYMWGVVYGAPAASLSGALVWLGIAFLWWAISGLENPPRPVEEGRFNVPRTSGE